MRRAHLRRLPTRWWMRSRNMASATSTCRRRQIESGVSLVPMRRLGADCFVVVRHRLCRPTANETLVSHCRVVGIELRRRVCFFVALKRGNARGAKGAGHRHLARVNRQREEPDVQWKAAAFARWHERMMREYQVRFCERLGVKFPGPTRPKCEYCPVPVTTASKCTADAPGT